MAFTRTFSGQVAEYRFLSEPLVWVEGPDDIPFYAEALRGVTCTLKPAGGLEQCEKLAEALLERDHPYVVVRDGDYTILKRRRSPHRRVVILQRHSMENYLFVRDPAEETCRRCAKIGTTEDLVGPAFDAAARTIETVLLPILVLDIAHSRAETGQRVLPKRAEALMVRGDRVGFVDERIAARCNEAVEGVPGAHVREARGLLRDYMRTRRCVDALPGHFAFGILRRLLTGVVKRHKKRGLGMEDDTLKAFLSARVWARPRGADHMTLRRRLRAAVRDAARARANQRAGRSGPAPSAASC